MQTTKREPVLIVMSVLATLKVLFGALAAMSVVQSPTMAIVCAVGGAVVGAVEYGVMYWVRGLVTPLEDVAAYRDSTGQLVSGPADPGTPDGAPVFVSETDPYQPRHLDDDGSTGTTGL